MDSYDEDFEEEIEETFEVSPIPKKKEIIMGKIQPSGIKSNPTLKTQAADRYSSEAKPRESVRKVIPLGRVQPNKGNSNDYVDLKALDKPGTNKSKNFYGDNYEDNTPKRNPTSAKSESLINGQKRMVKEFSLESLGLRKSSASKRTSISTSRGDISMVVNYYERYRGILESDISGKNVKDLEKENIKLRENLKDLNIELNKIIERAKLAKLPLKAVEFKYKDASDQIRTLVKEIANNEKILENAVAEYTVVKARLDKIKDPGYMFELDDKIEKTIVLTEETKRLNKNLFLEADSRGKDLRVIDDLEGATPAVLETNEKGRELAVCRRKLNKLRERLQSLDDEKEEKMEKLRKLEDEYRKLCAEARKYHITIEDEKKSVQYNDLQNKVKNMENHVKLAANTSEKYLKSQLEKAIEELYVDNVKENDMLEKLNKMIEEQRAALKEMLSEQEMLGDRSTLEVVQKIRHSLNEEQLMDFESVRESAESAQPTRKKSMNIINKKPPLPLPAIKKAPEEKYAGLPLYSPSKIKVGNLMEKKEAAKKEVSAIREQIKREQEERKYSVSPKNEKDSRTVRPRLIEDNMKLRLKGKSKEKENETEKEKEKEKEKDKQKLKEKEKKEQGPQKILQQAEQEKSRNNSDKDGEPKKGVEEEFGNLKPAFAKPNFMKKNKGDNKDIGQEGGSLQLPDQFSLNQNQESGLGNKNTGQKDNGLKLNINKKDEILKIQDNGALSSSRNEINGTFLTNPTSISNNKKEDLALPGFLNNQKKTIESQKNEELTLGGGNAKSNHQITMENKQNGGNVDIGEDFNIGGLSRLNKLKKGGTNNDILGGQEKKTELSLPGQKKPDTDAKGGELSLNNIKFGQDKTDTLQQKPLNNKEEGKKIGGNDMFGGDKGTLQKGEEFLGGDSLFVKKPDNNADKRDRSHLIDNKPNGNTLGAKNNDFLGGDSLFAKKEESAERGRRDRTHLLENKANNNDDSFGAKRDSNAGALNLKASFDPDDIFGSNDKTKANVGNINNPINTVGGLGVVGIPGARTGRAGVPVKPKQVNGFDNDSLASKNQNTSSEPLLGGGFKFGAGENQSEQSKFGMGFALGGLSILDNNKAKQKEEPKGKDKNKGGAGFFDGFDD